jgi:hypothetical protein
MFEIHPKCQSKSRQRPTDLRHFSRQMSNGNEADQSPFVFRPASPLRPLPGSGTWNKRTPAKYGEVPRGFGNRIVLTLAGDRITYEWPTIRELSDFALYQDGYRERSRSKQGPHRDHLRMCLSQKCEHVRLPYARREWERRVRRWPSSRLEGRSSADVVLPSCCRLASGALPGASE